MIPPMPVQEAHLSPTWVISYWTANEQEPLMQGIIDKVAVLILDSSGCVVERYVINLKVWQGHPVPSSPCAGNLPSNLQCEAMCRTAERCLYVRQVQAEILQSVDLADVESALRSCLLKLQFADATLAPLAKGETISQALTVGC